MPACNSHAVFIGASDVNADTVTAVTFYGSASFLTSLNATQLTSGTVPAARLVSANLPAITLNLSGVLHNTPVTITGGNGTATLANQTANTALLGPVSGAATTPTFRAIAPQDTAQRTTFSNANASISAGTAYLGQTGTMSASRVVTLPAANSVPAGYQLVIADESGSVSNTNTIVLTRAGADTINGATTEPMTAAYTHRRLISNGTNAWVFDAGVARLGAASNTFSGNQVFNGTANTMNNQTASAAGSPMTRSLTDARAYFTIPFMQTSDNQAIANGSGKLLGPYETNSWSTGKGVTIPSGFTQFRVTVQFGFLTNPSADLFPVYVRFDNTMVNNTATQETLHGTRYGVTCYPDDNTGLPGTLTNVGAAPVASAGRMYKFVSNWITIPAGWQTNATTNGWYQIQGLNVGNNSGGSLTDGYNTNHSFLGMVEFQR